MVNSMVERATSNMLIGPDWAMNIDICDICNRDPLQAKGVVKGLKKRLRSKNPKAQLLTLTLLETIVKNCMDIVHMLVAEKGLLPEMVKVVKEKPDFHVKEKILNLIYTWQEAFGGAGTRYPQYYLAYQDLLHIGAAFPQHTERSLPVSTPSQTQPLTSHPQNLHNPESRQEGTVSSAEAKFPTLSLKEIQFAHGIMNVLAEMLNALDPRNQERHRQDVIVDLVEQCRTYKQRVVHLVNSTSDESLLNKGLALNDELQRVLSKYESIASGTTILSEKPKPGPVLTLYAPLIDTGDGKQSDRGSISSASLETQLLLPALPTPNSPSTTQPKADPMIDLLSGDSFSSSPSGDALTLVLVGGPQPASPASQQSALIPVDIFSLADHKRSTNSGGQSYSSPKSSLFQNGGSIPSTSVTIEHSRDSKDSPAWNGHINQLQWPPLPVDGEHSGALPPPPWEAQQVDNNQFANYQMAAGMFPQAVQSGQMAYVSPQHTHGNQLSHNSYGYGQYMNSQFPEQVMCGLSVQNSLYQDSSPSYVPSGKLPKLEDKLFGDLVEISKFKPIKTTAGRVGSM